MQEEKSFKDVLIVEDSKSQALMYEEILSQAGYKTQVSPNGQGAIEILKGHMPAAILLDLGLPDINGMEVLKWVRSKNKTCPIIIFTAEASINKAVEALQFGADDFLAKPVSPERLTLTVNNIIEKYRLQKIAQSYESISRDHFCGFIGASPQMQSVYTIIENAASSRAAVLITGESGTGKELAAQAIHQLSVRKDQNIVAINCAAIPHNLLESEIFGHVKGAFTGAISNHEGAAKRADGGTLFLDELGEMPLELQSKLLRFIQTGSYTPVGGRTTEHVDVRFVCATNRDPLEAVRRGILREDLYYRLNVIPIDMPALRERGDDILLLAEAFLEWASIEEKKSFKDFLPDARKALKQYSWPGNVRELENVIWNAVIMHDGEAVTPEMLRLEQKEDDLRKEKVSEEGHIQDVVLHEKSSFFYIFKEPEDIRPFTEIERNIIEEAIRVCDGNITEAAKRLDINPSTVHRKKKAWIKDD